MTPIEVDFPHPSNNSSASDSLPAKRSWFTSKIDLTYGVEGADIGNANKLG